MAVSPVSPVSEDDLRAVMIEAGIESHVALMLDPVQPLLRQGVDSIDFPAFAAAVEDRYGVAIDEQESLKLKTLRDFAAFLSARLK